ncbi:MAG: amidohydrolase family protein [Defluviitaleaceae bacterium]|nr:amidohydrolase family protein [Defluviitaleaceae bacterium]
MILTAERIITGDGKTVLKDQAVYVAEDKIADIGDVSQLKEKYPDSPVKEYPGATLLPGLIDMHVHIGFWPSHSDAATLNDFKLAYFAADYAKRAFAKGVTTVRDVSSPKNLCVSINYAVGKGYLVAPRIITTDCAICFTGGHGWISSIEVDGPWAVRATIRDNIKRGAHWVKIMASHRTDTPEFTQEELNAAVDEAHRVGKKLAVHAGTQPSIQMAIDAGFDTIEHGTHLTIEQAKQMKEKGIVWCPTIAAYTRTYEYILENMNKKDLDATGRSFVGEQAYFKDAALAYKNNFKNLYETGVKIVVGTDVVYNNAPATPMSWEMGYMEKYGMPNLEIIKAATKSCAETLDIDHLTGEIAIGKQADILIVNGNPAEVIADIENIAEVFLGGTTVYMG